MFSIYLIIGAFAGMVAGLFGIGGGIVIVPALAMVFADHIAIPAKYAMHVAIGTSLATIIVTSASAVYAHHRHGHVLWNFVKKMIPGLIVGAVIGVVIAHYLPSHVLRIIFSVFLTIIGTRLLLNKKSENAMSELFKKMSEVFSVGIGAVCSILGISGGTLLVSFLLRCGIDMHRAVGTAVACGFAVSVGATASVMLVELFAEIHLPQSSGYIYWPAFFGIVTTSVVFAPIGAYISHRLPTEVLKKIFGVVLLITAIDMMFPKI